MSVSIKKRGMSGLVIVVIIIFILIIGSYFLFKSINPAKSIRNSILESEVEIVTSEGYTNIDLIDNPKVFSINSVSQSG